MKARIKGLLKVFVDHSLALNTGATLEIVADNYKFKMCLAGTIIPGMSGMFMTFVNQLHHLNGQILFQLLLDKRFDLHSFIGSGVKIGYHIDRGIIDYK